MGFNDLYEWHFGYGLWAAHNDGLLVLPAGLIGVLENHPSFFRSLGPQTTGTGVYDGGRKLYWGPFDADWWDKFIEWNPYHEVKGEVLEMGKLMPWIEVHPFDENASDKPAFELVHKWAREALLREYGSGTKFLSRQLVAARDKAVNAYTHPDSDLHVGDGLAHMPALTQIGMNQLSGATVPPVVMRDKASTASRKMWLQSEISGFVSGLALHTNVVESARNVVRLRAEALRATINDPDGGLDPTATEEEKLEAREDAMDGLEILTATPNLEKAINEEIAKHGQDALPDDLPTLQAVLIERIEAAAMARTKYLMKAATQQGIDRGFSCVDEERAVKEVATQCVLGTIEIKRTESNDDAKAAFEAAKASIDSVTVVNTPVWQIDGTDYAANPPDAVAVTGSKVTVLAKHPDGQTIPGNVALASLGSEPITVTKKTPTDTTAWMVEIAPTTPTPGQTVKIFLTAENLCGPSEIEIHLTAS